MDAFILYIVIALYFFVSATLFLYGLHCLTMLFLAWVARNDVFNPKRKKWSDWPLVTIQLPV